MKTAVILMAMGGPRNLGEVRGFLFRMFSDRAIINLSCVLRLPLAALLAQLRYKTAQKIYQSIGGGSPLCANTTTQAEALQQELGDDFRCFVGFSYTAPFIAQAVAQAKAFAPDQIILLPMYPQFSTTTTASVLQEAQRQIRKQKSIAPIKAIESFPTLVGFIEATAENLLGEYAKAKNHGNPKILFSAHAIPLSRAQAGDPYPVQCLQTAQAIAGKTRLEKPDWTLCYQSAVGPIKWTTPRLEDEITVAARAGRPIVVVPISFVCENSETLYDLNIKNRKLAEQNGCPHYVVSQTAQTHPVFIKALGLLSL